MAIQDIYRKLYQSSSTLIHASISAEASSSSAVRTARDIVSDFGENLADLSGGITKLAKSSDKNSERNCHRLMVHRFKLSMPIDHHFLDTNDDGPQVPILRFRDWMKMLLNHNCWHLLSGLVRPDEKREASIWTAFWKNFEQQVPQHPNFCASSIRRSLSRTLCGGGGTWGRREVEKKECIFGDQRSFCVGQGHTAWLEARQKTTLQQDAAEFFGTFVHNAISFHSPSEVRLHWRKLICVRQSHDISCGRIILCTTWRCWRFCSQEEVLGSLPGNNRGLALVGKVRKLATIFQQCIEARRFGGWQSPSLWRYMPLMPCRPTRFSIRGGKYQKSTLEADRSWTMAIWWRDPFRDCAAPDWRIAILFPLRSISCLALRCRQEFPRICIGTSIEAWKRWERRFAVSAAFRQVFDVVFGKWTNGAHSKVDKGAYWLAIDNNVSYSRLAQRRPHHIAHAVCSVTIWGRTLGRDVGWCRRSCSGDQSIYNYDVWIGCMAFGRAGRDGHGSWSSIFEALQQNGIGIVRAWGSFVDYASENTCAAPSPHTHVRRCRSRGACSQCFVHVGSDGRRFYRTWQPIVAARCFRFYYVS